MIASIQEAGARLAQLIEAVQRGEEVIIASNGVPVARLLSVEGGDALDIAPRRLFGLWKDKVVSPTDEEWTAMDREIAQSFEESEIFPK